MKKLYNKHQIYSKWLDNNHLYDHSITSNDNSYEEINDKHQEEQQEQEEVKEIVVKKQLPPKQIKKNVK